MKTVSTRVAALAVVVACSSFGQTPTRRAFPDAASLPAQAALPNPLVNMDGKRVASREEWFQQRRPELKELFAHYMYGPIPPKPARMKATITGEHLDFLGGKATLRLVTLDMAPNETNAPRVDLMLILPNQRSGPAPTFLAINFCGNQTISPDPRIPLVRGWLRNTCRGCTNGFSTEATRGTQSEAWPLAEIVGRGYALATFCNTDLDADRPDASLELYAWLAGNDPSRNNPTNRGTIAAWAWGFQRCVDYLVTDRDIDAKRIASLGHSRNGKTALLAAAFDERIAMAFPHQAGCGGSAPSRGKVGESVKAINRTFPHWFNGEFKKFNDAPERLPFDQNALVALCAPRPVLFSAAEGDQWANPAGQFEVLKAADPVYRFLGSPGLAVEVMPPPGKLIASPLGYYIREGKHSMTADDWRVFLDFADQHFKK
jgi:hypothetical protein